jgi:hypothetical protein
MATIKEIEIAIKNAPNDSIKKALRSKLEALKSGKEVKKTKKKSVRKKTAKKKVMKKSTKKTADEIKKAKAEIKRRTGKTEAECEKIIDQYKKLRGKAQKRKKSLAKSNKKVATETKQGKRVAGSKTASTIISEATKKAKPVITKEIEKKGKNADLVGKKLLSDTKKLIGTIKVELAKKDKDSAKEYLLKLRTDINKMLEGKFADGGMVADYNIQASLINTGNNTAGLGGGMIYSEGGLTGTEYDEFFNEYLKAKGGSLAEFSEFVKAEGGSIDTEINNFSNAYDFETGGLIVSGLLGAYLGAKYPQNVKKVSDPIENAVKDIGKNLGIKKARGGSIKEGKKVKVADYYLNDEASPKEATKTAIVMSEPSDDEELVMIEYTNGAIDYVPQDVIGYARGGYTQGYNDRLDESLGASRGARRFNRQSYLDRRRESEGMERSMGRRKYDRVGTMDLNRLERRWKKKGGLTGTEYDEFLKDYLKRGGSLKYR